MSRAILSDHDLPVIYQRCAMNEAASCNIRECTYSFWRQLLKLSGVSLEVYRFFLGFVCIIKSFHQYNL
jgi:hypothetical protein